MNDHNPPEVHSESIWVIRSLRTRTRCNSHGPMTAVCSCGYVRSDQVEEVRKVTEVIQESAQRALFSK